MKKNNKPMGVSQWREYGKKYGYWKYFEDQVNEKWEKKTLVIPKGKTHPVHDKCEHCFELARQEIEGMIRKEWEYPIQRFRDFVGKGKYKVKYREGYNQAILDMIKKL